MITMVGCMQGGDSPYYSVNHDRGKDLLYICKDGKPLEELGPFLPEEFPTCSEIINVLAFGPDFDGRLTEVWRRLDS